jgi:hypothetical protein
MMEVKSHKYDLSGKYLVTKKEGTFYKFTHRDTTRGSGKNSIISTYVPEEDVDELEGFDKKEVSNTTAGGARKTRKGRKGRKGTKRSRRD